MTSIKLKIDPRVGDSQVSYMDGSFENDAVILFANFFFHYSSHGTK